MHINADIYLSRLDLVSLIADLIRAKLELGNAHDNARAIDEAIDLITEIMENGNEE